MADKDLNAVLLDTLKDAAFEKHHDETEGQIERLEQVFELLGKPARGKKCDAIEGILDEGTEIMDEYEGEPALDAGLLAAAQAVEHYEISRYGTLKSWAAKLGMEDAVKLLDQTLSEEKKTDDALTGPEEADYNEGREKYREYAADCVRIAQTMDAKDRETLLRMAKAWEERAREAERNEQEAESDR
jgi:ferritin-like metal-binding protein YciE